MYRENYGDVILMLGLKGEILSDSLVNFTVLSIALFFGLFQEPFNLQLKVFMNEVSQQSLIPVIRR